MITVQMEENDVVDMLVDRVRFWTKDEEDIELYQKMYGDYCENVGTLSEDIEQIVDNDYINYCSIISQGDDNFDEILERYKEGERDISCEGYGYSFVEAVSDDETRILVRY